MPLASPVRRRLAILLGTWLLLYGSFTLFTPPLMDDADSVHAEVAREMLLRHDWVTLHADGIRYLEKAPFLYWSMAASMRVFGPHDWAARLPLTLGMLALLLAVYRFGRRAFTDTAGFYAAMILATTFGCFIYSRFLIPDALVCLWITLSLYAFWLTEQSGTPARLHCLAFAACCALNVLTKGLIGIVFPVGIALVYLLLTRGLRGTLARLRALHPALSASVFFVIAAPWHILAGLQNPTQGRIAGIQFTHWLLPSTWIIPQPTPGNVHGWFWFYFLNEHLLRYLNLRVPRDYDTVPLWIFWLLLFVWLMPWSAWLCCAHGEWLRVARNLRSRTLLPADRTQLLLVLWAATVMLFFTFSTRQEYYSLPALPALALLIAARLDHEISPAATAARRTGRRISLLILIIAIPASLAALYFLVFARTPGPGTDLSTLLQQNPSDYALSLGHFLDLDRQCLGLFRPALFLTAIALAPGALANFHFRRRNRPAAGNAALFAMMLVMMLAAHSAFRTFNTVLGSEPLAAAIAAQHPAAQDLIAIHGEYESGSTLAFYLRRDDLHILDGRSSNLWYGSFFPDAPAVFETHASLAAKWASPQRIFMWNDPSDTTRPLPALSPVYVIARSGGKQLLSNQPAH